MNEWVNKGEETNHPYKRILEDTISSRRWSLISSLPLGCGLSLLTHLQSGEGEKE